MGCRHGPKHILTAPLIRWVEGVQAETCIFPMLANSCSGPDITCAHTLEERRGQAPRVRSAGVAVIPVGQCPTLRPAQLDHGGGDDLLEACQIAAVPGQKEPCLVLALVP